MTTLTEPPLIAPPAIPDDVLERLLDDTDRVCELRPPPFTDRCERTAAWVLSGRCICGTRTRLACDQCKFGITFSGAYCADCRGHVEFTRVEPLRSPP